MMAQTKSCSNTTTSDFACADGQDTIPESWVSTAKTPIELWRLIAQDR